MARSGEEEMYSLKDGDRLEDRGVDLLVFVLTDFAILHFVTPGSEGYHISVMALGHSLTRSGLTYPEVLSKVYYDSFCQLGSSVSLPWVIYFEDLMFIGPYIILIDK